MKGIDELDPNSSGLRWRWSPLFETEPFTGSLDQPNYINAVLVVDGKRLQSLKPCKKEALKLLKKFLLLEKAFGRDRRSNSKRWASRTLDIDLLAWGELQVKTKKLTLPHPRLLERSFVALPLAEALLIDKKRPIRLTPNEQWPE